MIVIESHVTWTYFVIYEMSSNCRTNQILLRTVAEIQDWWLYIYIYIYISLLFKKLSLPLMARSHQYNQCWLYFRLVLWRLPYYNRLYLCNFLLRHLEIRWGPSMISFDLRWLLYSTSLYTILLWFVPSYCFITDTWIMVATSGSLYICFTVTINSQQLDLFCHMLWIIQNHEGTSDIEIFNIMLIWEPRHQGPFY